MTKQDELRQQALDELTQLGQESGDYENSGIYIRGNNGPTFLDIYKRQMKEIGHLETQLHRAQVRISELEHIISVLQGDLAS